MQQFYLLVLIVSIGPVASFAQVCELPPLPADLASQRGDDWLLAAPGSYRAGIYRSAGGRELVLSNGLIRRAFRIAPAVATVAFDNLLTGASMLRAVEPEAIIQADARPVPVGGLTGQPDRAYLLPEWLDAMKPAPDALVCAGISTGATQAPFEWKRVRGAASAPWPPPGVSLTFRFQTAGGAGLAAEVRYELYDGLPLLSKQLTIANAGTRLLFVNSFAAERLAVPDEEVSVDHAPRPPSVLHIETEFAFQAMEPRYANKAVQWIPDPDYQSQVTYKRDSPVLLEVAPPLGPNVLLAPGAKLEAFRVYELAHDSTERERRGLAVRRMYRTIAPWTQENPIFMHVRQADPASVRLAIDQCAEVGFEMVILTFGSGIDMEKTDPAYLEQIRSLVEYGRSKGVEVGGYSLLASRRIDDANDVIDPETRKPGKAVFGNSPCLLSRWGDEYFRKLRAFFEATGAAILEHDGSYPGDVCASESHPGHAGLLDSQWKQWERIRDFYRWCRARGVYLNVPDWYFLSGSNKIAMGYRETNWSLPRDRQVILARQNIYDGTWEKTPSMGWMFVPLVQYHGGGAEATLEPLKDHLAEYGQHLLQNFASGVQAAYRGPRLFDAPETKSLVAERVRFFKQHREILESDVIHLRRADGRDWDGILHVNPRAREKGFAILYNPLTSAITREFHLPLYYTGLRGVATVRVGGGAPARKNLDARGNVRLTLTIPPRGAQWVLFE